MVQELRAKGSGLRIQGFGVKGWRDEILGFPWEAHGQLSAGV